MTDHERPGSGSLADVTRAALSHPPMCRLQLASAAWSSGEAAYLVGLFVYAYAVGGPASVATIAVIRTVPSVVLAPLLTVSTRRISAPTLLRATLFVRITVVLLVAATLAMTGPDILVLLLVALDSVAATLLRPLRGSLLPTIARSPGELVAGNVALTTGDSLANLVGPGLAAAVLVSGGAVATFVPGIVLLGLAFLAALGMQAAGGSDLQRAPGVRERRQRGAWRAARTALPIIGIFTAQRFVRGAMTVLLVAIAIDHLGMGDPGVGVLSASIGLGGVIGGGLAVGLVGRRHLAPWFAFGIAVWSIPFLVVDVVPLAVVATLILGLGGVGKVLIDVAGYSLLQRAVPNEVRTPVLGLQEGLVTGALALGAVVAAVVIETAGIHAALLGASLVPLAAAFVLWPGLRQVDAQTHGHDPELELLERVPLFRPLPLAVKEELAAGLGRLIVPAGQEIVRQGDVGDRFFVIDAGTVEVEIDGTPGQPMTRGEGFGEIALLRDVPRTATVRALTDVELATLDRAPFLAAVTGHRESTALAEQVVAERLGG